MDARCLGYTQVTPRSAADAQGAQASRVTLCNFLLVRTCGLGLLDGRWFP